MFLLHSITLVVGLTLAWCKVTAGDVLVQLNVNRPFNDVNEKFVSFAMKPEELYKALDGPHRKSMSRIATTLGDSYVKFVGDYNFINSDNKLRNPTKVIWKGFNRWARAVNWTMIIPVPYSPSSWDPMATLKILNSSYTIGITDCIWQLGTDFGSSRAQDYVAELKTLNLMVDSFKPYVDNWKIMGADISAGSNPEETRRYVDMSKDLNEAFGWTQPVELIATNRVSSYIYENDAALKMLLSKKVTVWLSLPQKCKKSKQSSPRFEGDEANCAFRWAQTLGDAASSGFDAVFKRISASDLERPSFSYYVTALYKKVMGSRVFPARNLNVFAKNNKLYTHCANDVSGGIAFMLVNSDERSMQLSVRSLTKFAGTELWQYTLTMKNGIILLNDDRLTINSTLSPQIKVKNPDMPVQLSTPGLSVSFWVFPTVNLEHCQFTEIEADEVNAESAEKVLQKRYSSSDRLLKKLIQESSLSQSARTSAINRRRRYATFVERPKRFILETQKSINDGFKKLFQPTAAVEKSVQKRKVKEEDDVIISPLRKAALGWLKQFVPSKDQKAEIPFLSRNKRSVDKYFGPFFSTKDGRKTAFTKKITEIKKPERKLKQMFDQDEFDEEEFFKKIGDQDEPEYSKIPEGDVHLRHITNVDGEDVDEIKIEKKQKRLAKKTVAPKETVSEMKPLRLLPTEFYEALPKNAFKPAKTKLTIGGALNSLLFPEPFSKKRAMDRSAKSNSNQELSTHEEQISDSISEVEEIGSGKFTRNGQLAKDFLKAQEELSRQYLSNDELVDKTIREEGRQSAETEQELIELPEFHKKDNIDYFGEHADNYFTDKDGEDEQQAPDQGTQNLETLQEEYKETPWWDLSAISKKRSRRGLKYSNNNDDTDWRSNMISKYDSAMDEPESVSSHEYKVQPKDSDDVKKMDADMTEEILPSRLLTKVKEKVSRIMDILTRHMSAWYNTLSRTLIVAATNDMDESAKSMIRNTVN